LLVAGDIVLTLDPDRLIITDGAVAVSGRRIAATGKRVDLERQFAPARRIGGRGKLVMPGLFNCHSHLQVTAKGAEESANTRSALKDFI
jgi:cytosine/adenosine deaminase-related metal-dependent hydrolase